MRPTIPLTVFTPRFGVVETGAGHVQVSSLEGESEVIPHKPMSAYVGL